MNEGLDNKGIEKLIRLLGKKAPYVRVGVLQDSIRSDGAKMAVVGAAHEFGTETIPARSWLNQPIKDELPAKIAEEGFTKEQVGQAIREGTLKGLFERTAKRALEVVLGAFDTGGYGNWRALKASTLSRKKNKQILVETGQLKNAISSEVVG